MPLALVVSRADPASLTIRDALLRRAPWTPQGKFRDAPVLVAGAYRMIEIGELHLDATGLDREAAREGLAVDGYVFASKHKAASGAPSLTVHPIGNWDEALYGGLPRHVVPTLPAFMARCLRALAEGARGTRHVATFEATHHGPHLDAPACFVEIGSTESDWEDPALGDVVARALLMAGEGPPDVEPGIPSLVGIGGGHYAPRFTDLARSGRAAFGHILPGYAIDRDPGPGLLLEAVRGTPGCAGYAIDERGKPPPPALFQAFTALELGRWTEAEL